MKLRYVKDHKIISVIAAVVVIAVVVVVAGGFTRGSASGGVASGGVSSATCATALSYLKNAPMDVENQSDQDLYTESNNAYNAVYNAVGYGSKLLKDLTSLETDANVLSSGTSDNTSNVTADLRAVYSDCGQNYPAN